MSYFDFVNYKQAGKKKQRTSDVLAFSDEAWTPSVAGLKEWVPTIKDVQRERNYVSTSPNSNGYFNDIIGSQLTGAWQEVPNCVLPKCSGKKCKCEQANVWQNYCDDIKFATLAATEYVALVFLVVVAFDCFFYISGTTQLAMALATILLRASIC